MSDAPTPPRLFSVGPPQPGGDDLTCEQARRQIERMIEERDLKEVERHLLLAHVRTCAGCKAELESFRRLEVRLKESFANLDTSPHFNERLMAALPAPGSSDSPEWSRALKSAAPAKKSAHPQGPPSGAIVGVQGKRSLWRVYWLPIAMSAMIAVALTATFLRTRGTESDAPPMVANLTGDARRTHAGIQSPLQRMDPLQNGDLVSSGSEPVNMTLTSGGQLIASVLLAPDSQLAVSNRHQYRVVAGAAYFQVRKDRPKASAAEYFEVDAAGAANVRVTGTAFIVDVAVAPQLLRDQRPTSGVAMVCVEEGSVEVHSAATRSKTQVVAGKELLVTPTETALADSDIKARLSRLTQSSVSAAVPVKVETPAVKPVPVESPRLPPTPAVPFSWDMRVEAPLDLAGKTLAEGIEELADRLKRPPQLAALAEQMRGPLVARTELSFSIHSDMPLRSVLAWMARDVGGGFETGAEGQKPFFTTAPKGNLEGAAGWGAPPEEIRKALERSMEETLSESRTLAELVDRLSRRAGVTMIAARGAARDAFDRKLAEQRIALSGQTVLQKLGEVLKESQLGCAWYDHALFIAPPSRIEALTNVERVVPLNSALIGQPVNAAWVSDLKELVRALRYPAPALPLRGVHLQLDALHGDASLAEAKICAEVPSVDIGGLRFKSGVLGHALVASTLSELGNESPLVSEVAGLLSQPVTPGPVSDMGMLISQAANMVSIKPKVRFPALSNQAFVFKGISLGEALEWSAWTSGFGLKLEQNSIVISDLQDCYGPPSLQVVSLAPLVARKPNLAAEFPELFTRLLPQLYPTFYADTRVRCIGGKLVFHGDRRQLQLAQRLRSDIELALDTPAAAKLDTWVPPYRQSIQANLAEPFQGTGKLTRSFAGLLRQSELKHQLRCTVLVDPVSMRERAADQITDLDVSNSSVGKVLEAIAAKARLKVILEGDIIWLRP